jgi:chemotaxis protein methyltransferase CheR
MTPRAAGPDPATGVTGYRFSDADFTAIARLAPKDFGLHLTEVKKDLVYSRLSRRLRQLGLTDFHGYCQILEGPGGEAERMEMLSALTTNVTNFFREEHHFATLRDTVLPPLIAAARQGRRLRLWSAGCSAGQEPYSLALTLLDLCPDAARLDIRILASDVDPVILARAEAGIYSDDEVKSLPAALQARFLQPVPDDPKRFAIAAAPRALIRFGVLNLMGDWPVKGPFDVIFCRNVAIYFDKDTQARLWSRFAGLLTAEGHLFIGHSERLGGPAAPLFVPAGVTTFRKTGTEPAAGGAPEKSLEGTHR